MSSFNISVVIPVYNAENYIRRAIESVLMQPEVIELILVDDGSSDNSLCICQEMQKTDQRIIITQHEGKKNKGASASRNLGIKKVTNEFVAFLDSDDYYLPNRFSKTKLCFENDNSVDGVYEMIGIHTHTGQQKSYSKIEFVDSKDLFENLQPIGEKVWFSNDGFTVKKKAFDQCGFFDESLKSSEDTLQWFKMAAICKLIPGEINNFVALSEQLTTGLSSNKIQVQKDFVVMLLKLFQYCKSRNLTISRKEIVLKKLFYFASCSPYNQYFKGLNKLKLFIKIILTDPIYIIFKSSTFRLTIGNLFRYN